MKKLLYILALLPALVFGQTYNVAITNSLLGPVNLSFSNTTVSANAATVTGVTVNASVTNSFTANVTNEFSASVTNTFSPVNNITNEITVGGTTVNNTNTFNSYITNDIDIAGVVVTNIVNITNVTQTFVTTAGVSSISFTGAVDGAITFAGNAVTQTNKTFNFAYIDTDLGYTSIVSQGTGNVVTNIVGIGSRIITQQLGTVSGGGGLDHFQSTTGTLAQPGSFLYPTSHVPVFSSSTIGFFVHTNNGISLLRSTSTGQRSVGLAATLGFGSQNASGSESVAIGDGAAASAEAAIAIGSDSIAQNLHTVIIGLDAQSFGVRGIAIGRGAQAGQGAIAIGESTAVNAGVGTESIAIGAGDASTAATHASATRAGAIGWRARATNDGAFVITDSVNADKNTVTNDSITLSFNRGLFLTQTNTIYASITPSGYRIGSTAGLTVTQKFLDASSTIRTNIFIGGILVTGYTE